MKLDERLEHFEKNQLELGDEYGAEVLHRARERIAQLEAENERLMATLRKIANIDIEAYEVLIDALKDKENG